jgi:hypothetical protein
MNRRMIDIAPTPRHKFNTTIYIKRRTEKICRSIYLNCRDCSQRNDEIVFTILFSNFYFLRLFGKLHGWAILDKFSDKFVTNSLQAIQDLNGTIVHVGLVVLDVPLLAETFYKIMGLLEVVSGDTREQVVVNLVLKTSAEPVNKRLGHTMSSSNVSGSGDLKLPEVWSLVSIVSGHTIVPQAKNNGKKQSGRGSCHEVKSNGVSYRELSETASEGKHPSVVKGDEKLLHDRVLKTLGLEFKSSVFRGSSKTKGSLERLI